MIESLHGQHHAKRDLRTYAKSVDPDQPPRLRCSVWSGTALFDTRYINGTYFPCCVYILIMNRCFKHRIGADLGLHYMKCPKVPFRVTLAIWACTVWLEEISWLYQCCRFSILFCIFQMLTFLYLNLFLLRDHSLELFCQPIPMNGHSIGIGWE